MKVTNKSITNNWILILLVMVTSFILIGLFIVFSGNRFSEQATDSFYVFNLDEKKQQLKTEVLNRIDEINYEKDNLVDAEKQVLFAKIHHVHHILMTSDLLEIEDVDERKVKAIELFEEEVAKDSEYLYFALSKEAVMMRSGTDSNIVGNSLYDAQDKEGTYFGREIANAANHIDGIYVDYYWPKVKDGEPLKKTSYCYYMPEFDFVIGTGSYHEDIEIKLQDKIYERLQQYYADEENYVFVTQYDSTARVAGNPDFIGLKMGEQKTFDGDYIHNMFMDEITASGEGYITYRFYKKDNDQLSEKISYVYDIEGWDAYMGMGFYVDDLNTEVSSFAQLFNRHFTNEATYIILGLILLSIIIFALFQRGAFLQKEFLKQGDIIFEKLFDLSSEAIYVTTGKKVVYENEMAERIFHLRTGKDEGYQLPELKKIQNNVLSYTNASGRIYFLKSRLEHVSFHRKESIIHFITDITADYLKTNALEQMAYKDPLTGLKNRRAFDEDMYQMMDAMCSECNVILTIIDIDHFKVINDTYGHDVGDEVLKDLASLFNDRLRQSDRIYRYGGEEFIVILTDIQNEDAEKLLMSINQQFSKDMNDKHDFNCTFSGGMVSIDKSWQDKSINEIVKEADNLLYLAKKNGRTRIEY